MKPSQLNGPAPLVLDTPATVTALHPDELQELPQFKDLGYRVRRSPRKAKAGRYAPLTVAAATTTRSAEVLNTAQIARATTRDGVLIGKDLLSGTLVSHDPVSAYGAKRISSPNVIVLGSIGAGKSSLMKSVYCLRPLILQRRRVVVIDKKPSGDGGEGEYATTARFLNTRPFRFQIGDRDSTVLNLLDPVLLHDDPTRAGYDVRSSQFRLLRTICELAKNDQPLGAWQQKALRAAHHEVLTRFDGARRPPTLADLLPLLGDMSLFTTPGAAHPDLSGKALERLHQAGLTVRFLLEGLLDEFGGLFDGETSSWVNLNDRLTVFDISQLPEAGPAVSMVIATANVWLLGMMQRYPGIRTSQVVEEGWHMLVGPGGRLQKSNIKLSRALGLSVVAALHHLSDIPSGSDAEAMIKETGTMHAYAQDKADDAAATCRMWNLHPGAEELLMGLGQGEHLMKIGSSAEVHVQHLLSRFERQLIDTDQALL